MTKGPFEHYCHCGKWGAYGTPSGYYCREHLPKGGTEFGRARRTDPDTAHEAADNVDATALEQEVLDVILAHGPPRGQPMCVVQIHKFLLHHPMDSLSPRMTRLEAKGYIRCLGKRKRPNRYGKMRNQNVYEAVRERESRTAPPPKNEPLDLFSK